MNFKDFKERADLAKKNRRGCPDCRPKCPFCHPDQPWNNPWRESQCILNQPLMMVIPPEGVHLNCPVHPEGHHIFGPPTHWMQSEYDSTYGPIDYNHDPGKDLTFDSTRPYGTCTGDTIRDSFKIV